MSALTPHRRFIATTVCLTLLLALGIDRLLPEQATRESTLQYFVPWLTFWLVACAGILWLWWKQELTAEFWRTPELALGGFAIPLVLLVIAVVLPPGRIPTCSRRVRRSSTRSRRGCPTSGGRSTTAIWRPSIRLCSNSITDCWQRWDWR